jgi:RsbT co-antagonist protein rsbRD N-terminal domain
VQAKEAIAELWLGRVLGTYPSQTAAFLAGQQDRFRNPIGHTLKEGLAILLDELLRGMDTDRVRAALDTIVQIRAVEDCPPGRAMEFLFQLKPILRDQVPDAELEMLYGRIDEMALLAFELYLKYREKTWHVRANEVRRRVYVLERRLQTHEPADWQERSQ